MAFLFPWSLENRSAYRALALGLLLLLPVCARGAEMKDLPLEELTALWEQAKQS